MGLKTTGTIKSTTSSTTASDGLVILAMRIAEGKVVHCSLTGGKQAKGTEKKIA